MDVKDVTVISFNFEQGYKMPTVKAMIELDINEASDKKVTWVELTSEEIEAIISVARLVEQRLQTGVSLTSKEKLGRSQEIESLHKQLAKRYSNLYQLQEQAADHGAGQIPLSLHNSITSEEKAIGELEERLRKIQDL